MSQIIPFAYQGQSVRTVAIDGEPWFVAKDVAEILGYVWAGSATIRHVPEEWKGVNSVPTPYGVQEMALLSEQGLYFFLGRSDKPLALPFQKWIAGEVMPSIRRDGLYVTEEMLLNPDHLLRVTQRLAEEYRARKLAEAKVEELEPKAEFHDRVAGAVDAQSIRDVAKVLGTGQNRMFAWLRGERILMADNRPYQDFLDAGYFRVIEQTWEDRDGNVHLTTKTLVTGKGLAWLQKRSRARTIGLDLIRKEVTV